MEWGVEASGGSDSWGGAALKSLISLKNMLSPISDKAGASGQPASPSPRNNPGVNPCFCINR